MSKSVVIKQNQGYFSMLPIGSIIAWHRDMLGAEKRLIGLPPGWVECNGQKIDDPESLYHNLKIPDLNGDERFLRGGKDSGEEQIDWMQNHTHKDKGHTHYRNKEEAPEIAWRNVPADGEFVADVGEKHIPYYLDSVKSSKAILGKPTVFSEGVPRLGSETRPVNMSVIWIIKIKQVTAIIPQPTILSHQDAPTGSLYINNKGNVGIGTDKPSKNLDVKASGNSEGIRLSHQDGYGPVAELLQVAGDGHLNLYTGQTKTVKRIHLSADGDSWFTPTGTGKIGIGTKKPSAKLEVNGKIKATKFEGDGSRLSNLNLEGNKQLGGKKLIPIYRYYHGVSRDHFYCSDKAEGDNALRLGYIYEGIEFYAFK